MADNINVTPGAGAAVATDDVAGVHYQAIKLALGADGVLDTLLDSGQQTMADSVPVAIASNQSVLPVAAQPQTGNGLSIFRSLDLDETEEDIKTSPGAIYGVWVTNTATSTRFVKFYNATAANVTVGSTTPVITIGIPGNSSDDISGVLGAGGLGIVFDTAISVAATTAAADADTGAPSAGDVIINVFYK